MAERWEYRIVRGDTDDDFTRQLSAAGAAGWRVVGTPTIPPDGGRYIALLERSALASSDSAYHDFIREQERDETTN